MEETYILHDAIAKEDTLLPSIPVPHKGHIMGMGIALAIIFIFPIVGAFALNYSSTRQANGLISPIDETRQQEYIPALQASVDTQNQDAGIEYELSLAERFLAKAIKISNTSSQQTAQEREQIVFLLNQALESANKAIQLNAQDARAYTSRGRIYQAISLIKPEMKTLADADFAQATKLGSQTPTEAFETQDPVNLLPTKQAVNPVGQAIIAAPQASSAAEVSGSQEQNTQKHTVTFDPGTEEVFVPYSSITSTTQIYVHAQDNTENITLYIKNKEEGKGFTIAATQSPTLPLQIVWWEVR